MHPDSDASKQNLRKLYEMLSRCLVDAMSQGMETYFSHCYMYVQIHTHSRARAKSSSIDSSWKALRKW
jgi:hypothetical protein